MTCTKCHQPIVRGHRYWRTKKGPHHRDCDHPLKPTFDEAFARLARAAAKATDELTEKQLMEAIKQAITAGDFIKYVRKSDDAQSVVYIPFAEREGLRAQIEELKRQLLETQNFYRQHLERQ